MPIVNENEFTFEGRTYVARIATEPDSCIGCAFIEDWAACQSKCHPSCIDERRADGKQVLFVVKPEQVDLNSLTTKMAYQMVKSDELTLEQFTQWVDSIGSQHYSGGYSDGYDNGLNDGSEQNEH
jgi:hypothetical protein